jgi:hypothetical protein
MISHEPKKSKRASKVHKLTHSIISLFGLAKPNVTLRNYKEIYYKHYYFPKNLCEGIDFVAALECTSKKRAAEIIMARGFSAYMGDKVAEQIKLDTDARERSEKAKRVRFAFILKKFAREHGMDISKFI